MSKQLQIILCAVFCFSVVNCDLNTSKLQLKKKEAAVKNAIVKMVKKNYDTSVEEIQKIDNKNLVLYDTTILNLNNTWEAATKLKSNIMELVKTLKVSDESVNITKCLAFSEFFDNTTQAISHLDDSVSDDIQDGIQLNDFLNAAWVEINKTATELRDRNIPACATYNDEKSLGGILLNIVCLSMVSAQVTDAAVPMKVLEKRTKWILDRPATSSISKEAPKTKKDIIIDGISAEEKRITDCINNAVAEANKAYIDPNPVIPDSGNIKDFLDALFSNPA